nr:MAG TPA: tail completion protein [Caudoviricetes sp.]
MLNEIVNAISLSLSENFDGIDVHVNELEQGFEEPCFFIDLLNPTEKQIVGNRYLRSYLFDIAYFPRNNSQVEIFDVLDKMHDVLEYIKLEDGTLMRGLNRNTMEEDNVLHYFVTYEMFIYKMKGNENNENNVKMEKIELNIKLKEEKNGG